MKVLFFLGEKAARFAIGGVGLWLCLLVPTGGPMTGAQGSAHPEFRAVER